MTTQPDRLPDRGALTATVKTLARETGFDAVGITGVDLAPDERKLLAWLDAGYHGDMQWMARHGTRRSRPPDLIEGTLSIVSVRLDYWPRTARSAEDVLAEPDRAYLSRYALGRDYHKSIRTRLQRLADRVQALAGPFGYRAFCDSAPVLEKPLARNAGLGWIGKHTNLLHPDTGSLFFLGELYTDLDLVPDDAHASHCGSCRACIDACPTGAIVGDHQLDARLCISYLTIEHEGAIPEALRPAIGNRIYGCDDCQLVCPFNREAPPTRLEEFEPRHGLDDISLLELAGWDAATFLARTEGSAIRRIGHERFARNVVTALGNAPHDPRAIAILEHHERAGTSLVAEHARWALARQRASASPAPA